MASSSDSRQHRILDHQGDGVAIVCPPGLQSEDKVDQGFSPFPIQVYILTSVAADEADVENKNIPHDFGYLIERLMPSSFQCHLQVYLKPQRSSLACVAHSKAETVHRNRHGIWPQMVPSPKAGHRQEDHFHKFIFILDTSRWQCFFSVARFKWAHAAVDPGHVITVSRIPHPHRTSNSLPPLRDINMGRQCDRAGVLTTFELERLFGEAGGDWTVDELRRRNNGGASPVLYPAMDPAARNDVEFSEPESPSADSLEGAIETATYTDLQGANVTSVWDRKYGMARPKFSVRMYLGKDISRQCPTAEDLFRQLNGVSLQAHAWTLDFSDNRWTLEDAFEHNCIESNNRTPSRTAERDAKMPKLLRLLLPAKMPQELLDIIMSYITVPEVPEYTGFRDPDYRQLFIFFSTTWTEPDQNPNLWPSGVVSHPRKAKEWDGQLEHKILKVGHPIDLNSVQGMICLNARSSERALSADAKLAQREKGSKRQ